jgi:catechol 2,3-dioxygenase-like lactoylglutathione lyase family enzyme
MGSIPIGSIPEESAATSGLSGRFVAANCPYVARANGRYGCAMVIAALDHLVLTVADIEATVVFYERLGMRGETFGDGRRALRFGEQKMNLHQVGAEFQPSALRPTPGSADLCILVEDSLVEVARLLSEAGVEIELGPVERLGAVGAIESLYVRDPDGNLVELARPRSA